MKKLALFVFSLICGVGYIARAQSTKYPPSGGSTGTVTSITAGTGLTGGTITTSGTIGLAVPVTVANGGSGTSTAFTSGSAVYAGASGVYSQDHANFFWDATNHRLGIGTTAPATSLQVNGTISGQISGDTVIKTGASGSDMIFRDSTDNEEFRVKHSANGGVLVTGDVKFNGGTPKVNWDGDTAISKNSAGVIEVNNGTTGTFRDLKARALNATTQVGIGSATPTAELEIKGLLNQALAGTVAVSSGLTAVVGTGTSFLASLAVGSAIQIGTDVRGVTAIADNTHLTINTGASQAWSGVTAHYDGTPLSIFKGNGDAAFSVDALGGVTTSGNLVVGGSFVPNNIGTNFVDAYNFAIDGTTTCDGSGNCTGTGTHYDTQLQVGEAIPDPEGGGQFLFVSSITDATTATMTQVDVFGFTDLPLTRSAARTQPISAATVTAVGGSFSMNNAGYMSMSAIGFEPVLTVTANTNVDGSSPEALHVLGKLNVVGGTTKLGTSGVAFSNMGVCTVSSTTISTTPSNVTCTGVPASASVAVTCNGSAAFSTPAGDALYVRATGTASQLALNTVSANVTAMTFTCIWVQP